MKKPLIVALVCINAALLLALAIGPGTDKADAQVVRGGSDYMMVTGQIGTSWDAIYVVDLGLRRLLGLRYDRTRKQLLLIRGRRLANDFRRTQPQP